MKSKEEIVSNWLPRYTGEKLENFGKYILLTNFYNYVHLFAQWHNVEVIGEHDEIFKEYLQKIRAYAIDMETATIFSVGFYNKIPTGALLLVSDQPMVPEGVKTAESDLKVTSDYVENHIKIGIDSLKQLINGGLTVRHLRF